MMSRTTTWVVFAFALVLPVAASIAGVVDNTFMQEGGGQSLRISVTSPQVSYRNRYVLKGRVDSVSSIEKLVYSVDDGPEHELRPGNTFSQSMQLPGRITRIRLTAKNADGDTYSSQVTVLYMLVPPDVAASMGRVGGNATSQGQMDKLRHLLAESPPPRNTSAKTAQEGLAKMKGALAEMDQALGVDGSAVDTPSSKQTRDSDRAGGFPQLPEAPLASPPKLRIFSGNFAVSPSYLLRGTVDDKKELTRLVYTVNGSQPFAISTRKSYFSSLVPLGDADNTVVVTATNASGMASSRTIHVRVKSMDSMDAASWKKHRNPSQVRLSAAKTASDLTDPGKAQQGVWSLLANLGIGVYTGTGKQVMPGSETSEDDFWLYDFDVPGLARMANQPGGHVGDLSKALTKWGYPITSGELVGLYRDMFASRKDDFTPRLFRIWHIPLGDNPRLTRLQAWLLLVSLIPSNGGRIAYAQTERSHGADALATLLGRYLISEAHAGTPGAQGIKIQGDGSPSNYAVANHYFHEAVGDAKGALLNNMEKSNKTIEKLVKLNGKISDVAGFIGKVKDAATMVELYSYFTMDMDVNPPSVHMVHDTQYEYLGDEKVRITVTIRYQGPKPGTINHGVLSIIKLDLPKTGPIKDAGVRLRFDQFLIKHGYSYDPNWTNRTRMLTNAKGKVILDYETKNERPRAAQKMKTVASGQGFVTAEVDLAGAAHQFFNPFASFEILSDFLDMYTMRYPIIVSWHVPPQEFTLQYTNQIGEKVTVKAHTCDGIHWRGHTTQNANWYDDDGPHSIKSTGAFTLQEHHGIGKGVVPTSGEITGKYGYKFVDNLRLSMDTMADHKTARISLLSVLDGYALLDGHKAPFASIPGVLNRLVELKQFKDCP